LAVLHVAVQAPQEIQSLYEGTYFLMYSASLRSFLSKSICRSLLISNPQSGICYMAKIKTEFTKILFINRKRFNNFFKEDVILPIPISVKIKPVNFILTLNK
jgi:hypothetical protein